MGIIIFLLVELVLDEVKSPLAYDQLYIFSRGCGVGHFTRGVRFLLRSWAGFEGDTLVCSDAYPPFAVVEILLEHLFCVFELLLRYPMVWSGEGQIHFV